MDSHHRLSQPDVVFVGIVGRWASTAMVKRYTRAFKFEDAAKNYKGLLSDQTLSRDFGFVKG